MRKLKAAVAVLVDNDNKKIETIGKLYMNSSRLFTDDLKSHGCNHDKVYKFMNFLDRDERKALRKS